MDVTGSKLQFVKLMLDSPVKVLEHTYDVGEKNSQLKIDVGIVKIRNKFHCRIILQKRNNSSYVSPVFVVLSPNELQDILEDDIIEKYFNTNEEISTEPINIFDVEVAFNTGAEKFIRLSKCGLEYLLESHIDISGENYHQIQKYYEEGMEDLINVMEEEWCEIATSLYEELSDRVLKYYVKHADMKINVENTRKKLKKIYYKFKFMYKKSVHHTPIALTILSILISTYYIELTAKAYESISFIDNIKI